MVHWRDIERQLRNGGPVYCGCCKKQCAVLEKDYGHGAHEYCGSFGTHSDIALESECCESETLLLASELPEDELEKAEQ